VNRRKRSSGVTDDRDEEFLWLEDLDSTAATER
jgi:hypothetical protein